MKKMFKKSIACLIAVLMVVSAMPFTAFAAPSVTVNDFTAKTASAYGTFESDSDDNTEANYKQIYKNVLYSPQRIGQCYTSDPVSAEGENKVYLRGRVYYGNTVLLYDGETTPTMGIGFAVTGHSKPWNYGYGNVRAYRCNLYGSTDGISLRDSQWHGYDGRMNYTYIMFSKGNTIGTTSNSECKQGAKGYYGNVLQYSGDFSASYKEINLALEYTVGTDEGSQQTHKTGIIGGTSIYVLNYKKLIEKAKEIQNELKLFDASKYSDDSVNAYYTAINNMFAFDPTSYDYSDTKNAVINAANQMDSLMTAVDTAKAKLVEMHDYTFVNANGTKTTVRAQDDSTAYFYAVTAGNVPNTAATTKTFAGNHQHKWVEYSWPTSATNYTFTEVATEKFEDCTDDTKEEHKDASCTENGYDKVTKTCTVCGNVDTSTTNIDATGHDMVYTRVDFDTHTKECSKGDIEKTTEAHNFVDGVCEDCKAEQVDLTTYNKAVASLTAELEKTDIYTADSIAAAKSELESAKSMFDSNFVTTQAQVDALTAKLVTAQESLVRSKYEITFVIDKDGETTETTSYLPYGFVANLDAGTDSVLKWTVEAQNGTTKLGTTDRYLDHVVTRDATVTVYVTADADTETEQYSKVTFIGHNKSVVEVKYVAVGETIETSKVSAPAISFYNFKGWDKETVTGTGADITVTAEYEAQGTEKCTVVFGDFQKDYDYDSFVYLTDADANTRYAMYDANDNLLTYFVGKAFYVPHTDKVVIKEADSEDRATSAITGYYNDTDGKRMVYNTKYYIPEGATLVKAGLEITYNGKTIPFYAEKISDYNECSFGIAYGSLTGEISARSFVEYKTADGVSHIAYSSTVSQTL